MKLIFDSIAYSYSQIFFSNRKWFGIVLILSSMVNPVVGIMGFVGGFISNITALILKYDKEKIRSGFYGFNGILFSAAAAYFFELTPFMILIIFFFIILAFFISSGLENLLASLFNLPGLSLPFIITLFILFIFLTNYHNYSFNIFLDNGSFGYDFIPTSIQTALKSIGLIILQPNIFTGAIILTALLFLSRIHFINTIIALIANYYLMQLLLPDSGNDILILSSFNAVVTAYALGGSLIILSRKTIFLLIISNIMVIIFTGFFLKFLVSFSLPVLVLPFNVVVLSIIYSLKFRQEQSDFVLLYFKPGTPEENYYYHQIRKSRFEEFKYLFPELPVNGEWKISQAFNGDYTHKDDWKYAWDFVIVDKDDNQYQNSGDLKEDYYCYNIPVTAPLEGEIVRVIDNVPDNKIGESNLKYNWGNTIIIKHDKELYSSLSHLKMGSIKVKKGDQVRKGQVLANVGNSGRSPYPHLHFQFQLTDKVGEKTYKFPFSYYIRNDKNETILKSFDYPNKDDIVMNIDTHKTLKSAFDFQIGYEFKLKWKLNGKESNENWKVNVDINNNMFIESNLESKVYLFPKEKVLYLTDFIGNKKSALYYFYLLASKIPLGYNQNLKWNDTFQISLTINKLIRYFSEFFLMITPLLKTEASYNFQKDEENNFTIKAEITSSGIMILIMEN
jgi:murein DD-endopeptidase MepM/ murein hydrolase activator NlpD/urea transporter